MEFLFQLVIREEKGKDAVFEYLRQNRDAGIEKLYVIWKTLNFRKKNPALFIEGSYIPLAITGAEISAAGFARHNGKFWALVVVPLGMARHDAAEQSETAGEQFLVLPENAPGEWLNIFTGERFEIPNQIALSAIFKVFPVAFLVGETTGSI